MADDATQRISTGIPGLDELLHGGLVARRRYLVRGGPGRGKTTLGLSFLSATPADKTALFIGFQEPEDELRANAATVGIDLGDVHVLSLAPSEEFFTQREAYDVFAASDVEQEPLIDSIVDAVERIRPTRVFVDSLTQLRFLSSDVFQYRKQVLSFLRFVTERGATVVFSSESSTDVPDDDLQFISDAVINLQADNAQSTVTVTKFRGSGFMRGAHQFRADHRGLTVFPRMRPPTRNVDRAERAPLTSGIDGLDPILHGGLEAGTVTLITGPTGVGKSTLASHFAIDAAANGRRAAIYLFEEEVDLFVRRSRALGLDIDRLHADGALALEQVEPLRYLADEFTSLVRHDVEENGVELVVIDSITGFELALASETVRMALHALAKNLARLGISVILVNETAVSTEEFLVSERDISYLSDNVIYLHYVHPNGSLRRGLGVLKKRLSGFESGLHPFELGAGGIRLQGGPQRTEPVTDA